MTWGVTAVVGGVASLGSAYLGADAARDAARTTAGAADRAGALTQAQYEQNRRDQMPWLDVARGRETGTTFDEQGFNAALEQYNQRVADLRGTFGTSTVARQREAAAIAQLGPRPTQPDFETTQYEGGALQRYADYGPSQVATGDYIPASDAPQFDQYINNLPQIRSDIPQFDVQGAVPEFTDRGNIQQFDPTGEFSRFNVQSNIPTDDIQSNIPQFDVQGDQPEYNRLVDINQDPGVRFRQQEQERAINRNFSRGGLLSGNRLEEIMKRSGELASQEYAAADARNVRDYDIARQREETGYGRDLTAFEQNRLAEQSQYGRDVSAYDRSRAAEQDQYGRDLTAEDARYGRGVSAFDINREQEQSQYGRGRSIYDLGYRREGDIYSRGLTVYDAARQNELSRYGRDVDAYGRAYGLGTDQFNAAATREGLLYGRGVADYGRAYGAETDYLNRLAAQSRLGQTTASNIAAQGTAAANSIGANLVNSAQAQGAGRIGQASAYQGLLGDLTALGTTYAANRPPRTVTDYNPTNTPYLPARY